MKEKYRYFSHTECEYFPCHARAEKENFNCLFCFCPLYDMGSSCGGDFRYTKTGVKDCSGCLVPHQRENYERIMEMLKQQREKQ